MSKPVPIKDLHTTALQTLSSSAQPALHGPGFFFLLPISFIPPQAFRISFGHSILAIPLQGSSFGTQRTLSEPHLKSRAFVLHQWFPLLLSLGHLEERNYRINTGYSEKGITRNFSSCKVLFSHSKSLTCLVSGC